MKFLSVLVEVE